MDVIHLYDQASATYTEYLSTADPRTKDWFLLNNSPKYVLFLTSVYLACVALLPRYMKSRPAVNIPVTVIFLYNISLVGLSLYITIEICLSLYSLRYNLICDPYNEDTRANPAELRMTSVLWWYFFSKVIELADTILIMLRKKDSQVTFLHVFHHTSMLNLWWWVMMFMPGGALYFGSLLNSIVHVFMYTYYALAVIPRMKKYLWWKKWITKMQLLQFLAVFLHSVQLIVFKCDFPVSGPAVLTIYMAVLFTLFINFYVKTYRRKCGSSTKEFADKEDVRTLLSSNGSALHHMNGIARTEWKKDL